MHEEMISSVGLETWGGWKIGGGGQKMSFWG